MPYIFDDNAERIYEGDIVTNNNGFSGIGSPFVKTIEYDGDQPAKNPKTGWLVLLEIDSGASPEL